MWCAAVVRALPTFIANVPIEARERPESGAFGRAHRDNGAPEFHVLHGGSLIRPIEIASGNDVPVTAGVEPSPHRNDCRACGTAAELHDVVAVVMLIRQIQKLFH